MALRDHAAQPLLGSSGFSSFHDSGIGSDLEASSFAKRSKVTDDPPAGMTGGSGGSQEETESDVETSNYVRQRQQRALIDEPPKVGPLSPEEKEMVDSIVVRSHYNPIGTCWMLADARSTSTGSDHSSDDWDGYMTVGDEKVKIKDACDLLSTRYAFVSGAKTSEGYPIMTFPDVRIALSFAEYKRLLTYLLDVPPLEDSHLGYVLVIDKRMDRWSNLKFLLNHITQFFPATVRVLFVLKPESVLQRAIEFGYRKLLDNFHLRTVVCQSLSELHVFLQPSLLSLDLGGKLQYNHLEWVRHRMDIERMKSSTQVIAKNLAEFDQCLRDTEMPNDVESTQHLLDTQRAERDAIKEDFRIAVRKGMLLLQNIRQPGKRRADGLSPNRLHNVTNIERLLVQLDETEKNFDRFWNEHMKKLHECLSLRMFENDFKQLQMNFAMHMLTLEEQSRDVGDTADSADHLITEHEEYLRKAKLDIAEAERLRQEGEALAASEHYAAEISIKPKCQELKRLEDALHSSFNRRMDILRLSRQLHQQISAANSWCSKGVGILSSISFDVGPEAMQTLHRLKSFLAEGSELRLDTCQNGDLKHLVLMTTTDTSTLLQQVLARIEDVRVMCERRADDLQRIATRDPSPDPPAAAPRQKRSITSPGTRQIEVIFEAEPPPAEPPHRRLSLPLATANGTAGNGKERQNYVITELVDTEQAYVTELQSVLAHYRWNGAQDIPPALIGQESVLFGNLDQIATFHSSQFLPDLQSAGTDVAAVARCFLTHRDAFYLYSVYCRNKSKSDGLREAVGDGHPFFLECQKKAGHRLALGAYLLKPVQRITKYQLLLKELSKCNPQCSELENAVASMLQLLSQLNANMDPMHVVGFPGNLPDLGRLHSQGRFSVWPSKRAAPRLRRTGKAQHRVVMLYARALLLAKPRAQPPPYSPVEYAEYKQHYPLAGVQVNESVKGHQGKFELTLGQEVLVLLPADASTKRHWVDAIRTLADQCGTEDPSVLRERPVSWTSTDSSRSSRDLSSNPDLERLSSGDSNNNPASPLSLPGNMDFVAQDSMDSENNTVVHEDNSTPAHSSSDVHLRRKVIGPHRASMPCLAPDCQ